MLTSVVFVGVFIAVFVRCVGAEYLENWWINSNLDRILHRFRDTTA